MAKNRDIKVIRQELKDIRYYNLNKNDVATSMSKGIGNNITEIVKLYADSVIDAPIKLYHLYIALYVNGHTQYSLANEWGFTCSYIKKLNNNLCEYFQKQFEAKGVS